VRCRRAAIPVARCACALLQGRRCSIRRPRSLVVAVPGVCAQGRAGLPTCRSNNTGQPQRLGAERDEEEEEAGNASATGQPRISHAPSTARQGRPCPCRHSRARPRGCTAQPGPLSAAKRRERPPRSRRRRRTLSSASLSRIYVELLADMGTEQAESLARCPARLRSTLVWTQGSCDSTLVSSEN
jgi:hypothetical protein